MPVRQGVRRPSSLCRGQSAEAVGLQGHCESSACGPPRRAQPPLIEGSTDPSLPNRLRLSLLSLKRGGKCQIKGYSEFSPSRTVHWLQNSLKDFHTTTRMRFNNHILRNTLLKTSINSSSGYRLTRPFPSGWFT